MSLTAIKPYFREIMDTLDFTEWSDYFDTTNIPSNILDRSYAITLGPINGEGQNHLDQETLTTVSLSIFVQGYRDPQQAIDDSIQIGESVILECLKVENRLTAPIKNVVFNSMEFSPLSETNNNAVIINLEFNVRIILCV